jgi:hypothetical protein
LVRKISSRHRITCHSDLWHDRLVDAIPDIKGGDKKRG